MINAIVQNKQGETAVIDLTVHYFAADLYVNNELVAQLDLQLQEGVAE